MSNVTWKGTFDVLVKIPLAISVSHIGVSLFWSHSAPRCSFLWMPSGEGSTQGWRVWVLNIFAEDIDRVPISWLWPNPCCVFWGLLWLLEVNFCLCVYVEFFIFLRFYKSKISEVWAGFRLGENRNSLLSDDSCRLSAGSSKDELQGSSASLTRETGSKWVGPQGKLNLSCSKK